MSPFELSMEFIRPWEGWKSNDKSDPGMATQYGISLRFLRSIAPELGDIDGDGDVDEDDVWALTPERSEDLFWGFFWKPQGLDLIPPKPAMMIFDTSVNMGRVRAGRILQMTINSFGYKLRVDGIIGPMTREVTKTIWSERRESFPDRFGIVRVGRYDEIVEKNHELGKFFRGWCRRTLAMVEASR
jgi:lysozyme family protein